MRGMEIMAFTQQDLDAINAAIATGQLEVESGGRKVRYRTIKELRDAREIILADLRSRNVAASTPRTSFIARGRA